MDFKSRYEEQLKRWRAERPATLRDVTEAHEEPESVEEVEGGRQYVRNIRYKIGRGLPEMVLRDNTRGFAFPGCLLWTQELLQGRMSGLRSISGRPPVRVTIDAGASRGDSDAASSFVHDGTFSSFSAGREALVRARKQPVSRVHVRVAKATSMEASLLELGMSASGWGQHVNASALRASTRDHAFALMSIDQIRYSLVMDAPGVGGALPLSIFEAAPEAGEYVLDQMQSQGEVGYVRAVAYGRRVLLSITARAADDDLRAALRLSGGFGGVSYDGSLAEAVKKVWSSMQVEATVVGGEVPKSLVDALTGTPSAFLDNVNKFLSETEQRDDPAAAVPVSFEVRYASDDAPLQTYETAEYSGRIPGDIVSGPRSVRVAVQLTGRDAVLMRSDAEIDSDDWTGVNVAYTLAVTPDRRAVTLHTVMDAIELEDDASDDGNTWIRTAGSTEIYRVPDGVPYEIAGVDGPLQVSVRKNFRGEVHGEVPFGDVGVLKGVRVSFDGPSSDDRGAQGLRAEAQVTVNFRRRT